MRVDTAQRITQWCWSGIGNHRRTAAATNLSGQSSQSAEHVVVNCTTEDPEHVVLLEVQARHPGNCELPQSVSGGDQRQNHSQRACGENPSSFRFLFVESTDFVITNCEVADLCLHRFEDRLNLLHLHILDDAIEVVFVFTEVHCCSHTRIQQESSESLVDWEHVKQGHVKYSTDVMKNLSLQHFAHFVVLSVDQCKTFCFFMHQPNRSLGARQHEYVCSRRLRFLRLIS